MRCVASLLLCLLTLLAVAFPVWAQNPFMGKLTVVGGVNSCGTETGSGNAYACAMAPSIRGYAGGACYSFVATHANTGTATLAINGLATLPVYKPIGSATTILIANDIVVGQHVTVCLNAGATAFQMASQGANTAQVLVFDVRTYGARCDAVADTLGNLVSGTDDTAHVLAAIAAADAAGGGTIAFPPGKSCYLAGQLTFPAGGSPYVQKPFRLTGDSAGKAGQQNLPHGGTILLMASTGVAGAVAKIDTRGSGFLEIDHLVMQETAGANSTPFIHSTNTILHIHDNKFYGHGTKSLFTCDQDVIILGGTSATGGTAFDSAFAGYGTIIERNQFDRIRRAVFIQSTGNANTIAFNDIRRNSGSDVTTTIEAATQASPAVLTVTGHGFPIGSTLPMAFHGFSGSWAGLNMPLTATVLTANTFSVPVDSTLFGPLAGTPVFYSGAAIEIAGANTGPQGAKGNSFLSNIMEMDGYAYGFRAANSANNTFTGNGIWDAPAGQTALAGYRFETTATYNSVAGGRRSSGLTGSLVIDASVPATTRVDDTTAGGIHIFPNPALFLSPVTLNGNALAAPTPGTDTHLQVSGADAANTGLELYAYANNPRLTFFRANTSNAAPSAVTTDNILGTMGARGYDGTLYSPLSQALMQFRAGSLWTGSNHEAYIRYLTTPNGATSPVEAVRITSAGGLNVGNTSNTAVGVINAHTGYTVGESGGTAGFVLRSNGTVFVSAQLACADLSDAGPGCGGGIGGVTGVSNSDGTLTISPTTGAVVASLALGHTNTWTASHFWTPSADSVTLLRVRQNAGGAVFDVDTTNVRVGLGTEAPAVMLHLQSANSGAGIFPVLRLREAGSGAAGDGPAIDFYTLNTGLTDSNAARIASAIVDGSAAGYAANLVFSTTTAGGPTPTDRLWLYRSGALSLNVNNDPGVAGDLRANRLRLRDSVHAFDVVVTSTDSAGISADRILTLSMGNVAHTLEFGTVANTITFPSVASDTVAMLNVANLFTQEQTIFKTAQLPLLALNSSGTASPTAPPASAVFWVVGKDAAAGSLIFDTYATTGGSSLTFRRASGTGASSPAQVPSTVSLGGEAFQGWDGTGAFSGTQAQFRALTTEAWVDATHHGVALEFLTTSNASATLTARARIGDGLMVGTSTDPGAGVIVASSALAVLDSNNSAAFNVKIAATSSVTISADRTLTLDVGNVAHTVAFGTTANTITFPSVASDTVVMLAASQTLTNKTLTSPTIAKIANLTSNGFVQTSGGDGTLGVIADPLTETHGGTAQSTYTQGDLLYASASNTLAKLAKNTSSTRYLSNTGTSNNPAWAQVDLTTGVTGTLPVGNGGSGTATAFTAGSVIFAGASGVYSQNNSLLFWDDTTHCLVIGAATCAAPFRIVSQSSAGNSTFDQYSANPTGAVVRGEKFRGTLASPLRAKLNDVLVSLTGVGGYAADDASAATAGSDAAQFRSRAAEDMTSTAQGSYLELRTTPTGSVTIATRVVIDENGMVILGSAKATTSLGGSLKTGVAFANLGTPDNGTLVFCTDCDPATLVDQTCASAATKTGSLAVRQNGVWKCLS